MGVSRRPWACLVAIAPIAPIAPIAIAGSHLSCSSSEPEAPYRGEPHLLAAPDLEPGRPLVQAQVTGPSTVFLWYADGQPAPEAGEPCLGRKPATYACAFGPTLESCQRQVQTYLDRWYADFNVVFTFTRPARGPYHTVVATGDGAWCGQDAEVAGAAALACRDIPDGVAYALVCGLDAKLCASAIAQEHAHLVGLAHTNSRADVMFATFQPVSDGFEDKDNQVMGGLCRARQNSYAMMLAQFGRWPGGAKPGPFAGVAPGSDGGAAPDGSADGGSGSGTVTGGGPVGPGIEGGGFNPDAEVITRFVPEGGLDPVPATGRGSGGGCATGRRGAGGAAPVLVALLALAAVAAKRRR